MPKEHKATNNVFLVSPLTIYLVNCSKQVYLVRYGMNCDGFTGISIILKFFYHTVKRKSILYLRERKNIV